MEIVGVGTEIVECLRIRRMIERHGELFLRRAFTEAEISACQGRRHSTEAFATAWASKEAVLKCLGLARRKGIAWTEIEIAGHDDLTPSVSIGGGCGEVLRERGVDRVLLTTSQCRAYVTATAIAVRNDKRPTG